MTPAEYMHGAAEDFTIVDTSQSPALPGRPYIDLTRVCGPVEGFAPDQKLLIVCNKGRRAYLLQNRLKHFGYTNTRVLEGGTTFTPSLLEE